MQLKSILLSLLAGASFGSFAPELPKPSAALLSLAKDVHFLFKFCQLSERYLAGKKPAFVKVSPKLFEGGNLFLTFITAQFYLG